MQAPKTLALMLGLSAVAMLFSTPAQADDAKVYPGVMCQPTVDDDNVMRYWGRVFNKRSSTTYVECPIVRDIVSQDIAGGNVWVLDKTDTGSVSCTLGMINPTSGGSGSVSGYFSTRSSSYAGFSSSPQMLTGFSSLDWITNAPAVIRCSIPAIDGTLKSGVTSYRINEDT